MVDVFYSSQALAVLTCLEFKQPNEQTQLLKYHFCPEISQVSSGEFVWHDHTDYDEIISAIKPTEKVERATSNPKHPFSRFSTGTRR